MNHLELITWYHKIKDAFKAASTEVTALTDEHDTFLKAYTKEELKQHLQQYTELRNKMNLKRQELDIIKGQLSMIEKVLMPNSPFKIGNYIEVLEEF